MMQQQPGAQSGDRTKKVQRLGPWRVLLPIVPKPKTPISSSLVLIEGFAALILIGGILLMIPQASKMGTFTSPGVAFFTSTSAVCVTGLTLVDTADYWSRFGQVVILALIQIGGFGFMTSASLFLLAFGRRMGLREKILIGESMGVARLGGIVKIVVFMAIFSLLTEAAGAALFYLHFMKTNVTDTSIWLSAFHAVSAFNNAGFDLSGGFQSLIIYQSNPLILLPTAALIILGGLGFLVVFDFLKTRARLSRLSLDSKMVFSATVLLLATGMVVILITEFNNPGTLGNLTIPTKLMNAFFQSVTARTAGFTTINVSQLANYALFFIMLLMFVGGASGSTAGGIKVNTFSMLTSTIWSSVRGREHPGAFGREFAVSQIFRALAVVLLSMGFVSLMVLVLTVTESFRFMELLFEVVSAFGTVGLSTGITADLSLAGQIIIMVTMFVGRLGPLTLTLALVQHQHPQEYRYPQEMVRIG